MTDGSETLEETAKRILEEVSAKVRDRPNFFRVGKADEPAKYTIVVNSISGNLYGVFEPLPLVMQMLVSTEKLIGAGVDSEFLRATFPPQYVPHILRCLLEDAPIKFDEAIERMSTDAVIRASLHAQDCLNAVLPSQHGKDIKIADCVEHASKLFNARTKQRLNAPEPGRPKTVTSAKIKTVVRKLGKEATQQRVADKLEVHIDTIKNFRRSTGFKTWPQLRSFLLSAGVSI
jgi:hypothetical protein